MLTLPLSKTLDPKDFESLGEELQVVDRYFTSASPQHPMRRWEYAMALRAQQQWYDAAQGPLPQGEVIDVGGAGSPFWRMINLNCCRVIDPKETTTLAEHLRLGAGLASEVYCISVLEHVDDLDQFCYHLGCLVAPGGLLFLTMDYCDGFAEAANGCIVPDTYHYHWDRQRIFNAFTLGQLRARFLRREFAVLGETDYTWRGTQVHDYNFASLALVKRS